MKLRYGLLLLFCLWATGLNAAIAIIPYRVINPTKELSPSAGEEYARLMGTKIRVGKTIEVVSQGNVMADLKRFGIRSGGTIGREDLALLERLYDYILLGTLSKTSRGFKSQSILYSVREKRPILKTESRGKSLFALARSDYREAMATFENRMAPNEMPPRDLLFMLDMSYYQKEEWQTIREGILSATERVISQGRDHRIYLVPFSSHYSHRNSVMAGSSSVKLKDALMKMKPRGRESSEAFERALSYVTKNITWRKNTKKNIILIANSRLRTKFPEQYGMYASRKGIVIDTLSMGRLDHVNAEPLRRLASASGGRHSHVSYHQRLTDPKGMPVDLYFERGRLFQGFNLGRQWRMGILKNNRYNSQHARPRLDMEELYGKGDGGLSPYDLQKVYEKRTEKKIIEEGMLESNLSDLLGALCGSEPMGMAMTMPGRALLSDGRVSFWVDVKSPELWTFLEKQHRAKAHFNLGLSLREMSGEAHGIVFIPLLYDMANEDIPQSLKRSMNDLIRGRQRHLRGNLIDRPLWFVRVKTLMLQKEKRKLDIRDE